MAAENLSPKRILLQIVILVIFFYLVILVPYYLSGTLFGIRHGTSMIWNYTLYSFESGEATLVSTMVIFGYLMVSAILPYVVERSRKCLDFVLTISFVHFGLTWISHGFPFSLPWWCLVIGGTTVSTLIGEYLCLREEQREIKMNSRSNSNIEAIELGAKIPKE